MVSNLICFDVLARLIWQVEIKLNTGKKHRWRFPPASVHCHHVGIWPVTRRMNARRKFLPSSAQFTDTDVGWKAFPVYALFSSAQLYSHSLVIFQTIWVPAQLCLICLKRTRRLYSTEYQFNKTTFQLLQNRILQSLWHRRISCCHSLSIVLMSAAACEWLSARRPDWLSNS